MSTRTLVSVVGGVAGSVALGVTLAFAVPGLPARSDSSSPSKSPSPSASQSTSPSPKPGSPTPSSPTSSSPTPSSPAPSSPADPSQTPDSPSPSSDPASPKPSESPSGSPSESPSESPSDSPSGSPPASDDPSSPGPSPSDASPTAPPPSDPSPSDDKNPPGKNPPGKNPPGKNPPGKDAPSRGLGPKPDPDADLYPQPPFTAVDGNRAAALLQRLYDAQTKQRSLRNQIAIAKMELAAAEDAVEQAKAELRSARLARDRARTGLQDSVEDIYKSGAPYELYHALQSPSMLRHGPRGQLSAYADASDRIELLLGDLAAAVDGRDALRGTLADLRRSLRQANDTVRTFQRKAAGNIDKAVPDSGTPAGVISGGDLLWPVRGAVTSGYGNRFDPYYRTWQLHAGVDIAARPGTEVVAASTGRVTQAGWNGGYGNYVCVAHGQVRGQTMTTCYAHLSRIDVTEGQTIQQGQRVGLVGSSGASTGPHLHFEVRLGGRPTDPRLWL